MFLLQNVTARIKGGLAGITPGTEVTLLRKNPDGTLHVKVKASTLEADIKPGLATNDRDLAAKVKGADDDEQAQAADGLNQVQDQATRQRLLEQIRAGDAMDEAAGRPSR